VQRRLHVVAGGHDGIPARLPRARLRHRGEVRERLDASGPQHAQTVRASDGGIDERGLPQAGLAADDQGSTAALVDFLQELGESVALFRPTKQLH